MAQESVNPQHEVSILIVDDHPDKVLALEASIESLGSRIVTACSGRDALRHVLHEEFAVILLDVNMPGMDGFETASLIRQRRSSRDTPIIFITAFGDEMHESRGYQLGAVDYILAPVVPDVLRTKVGVFVDLFRKTQQLRRQAETLERRALQFQRLAVAAQAINSPGQSAQAVMQTITDAARDVLGSHQAITLLFGRLEGAGGAPGGAAPRTTAVTSFSEKYSEWRARPLQLDMIATSLVAQSRSVTRLSEHELHIHPDWEIVRRIDMPAVRGGILAAPLSSHDGNNIGVIYLSDSYQGDFDRDDEAVLVQLAQMASIAMENTLFARERESNRVKDEFLATLSHELRTPLSAILGWSQILGRRKPDPDVRRALDVIERNAKAQLKLIEDLLDVSRITAGKLRVNLKSTSLQQVMQAALDSSRPAAEAKEVELIQRCAVEPALVMGDLDRLQQVVWNLVINAIKFTPARGRVTVELVGDDATLSLRVTDTGRGIAPDQLERIFEPFRQVDSSSKRAQAGLGIGLTIVRHLLELHGGSVRAESEGEGRGASFVVTLPRLVQAVANGAAPRNNGIAAELWNSGTTLKGVHVLLVEDVDDVRDIFARVLGDAGAEVHVARSVDEAIDQFGVSRPDVIVSDIAMPGRDGYDLIRTLRALPAARGGETPALALTAYARDEDRERFLTAGFQSHLAKPARPADLIEAVAALHRHRKPSPNDAEASEPSITRHATLLINTPAQ